MIEPQEKQGEEDQARDAWMDGNVHANGHDKESEVAYFARQAFQAGFDAGATLTLREAAKSFAEFMRLAADSLEKQEGRTP